MMIRIDLKSKGLALGIGMLPFIISGCDWPQQPRKPQEPKFEQFGVSPNIICTNIGVPLIRISWKVKGEGDSCLSNLKINGTGVDGNIWDVGIQNGRCGTGDYSRESAFSLNGVFNNNIPSQMTVSADLTTQVQAGVFVSSDITDSASANVAARECEPGFTPGG